MDAKVNIIINHNIIVLKFGMITDLAINLLLPGLDFSCKFDYLSAIF